MIEKILNYKVFFFNIVIITKYSFSSVINKNLYVTHVKISTSRHDPLSKPPPAKFTFFFPHRVFASKEENQIWGYLCTEISSRNKNALARNNCCTAIVWLLICLNASYIVNICLFFSSPCIQIFNFLFVSYV